MIQQLSSAKPIAVLIDAENAQLSALPRVLARCEELGCVALKRAYGDFTLDSLKDWPKAASDLSIHPIQQFRIVAGKSISDCALIIDAMDLLHSERYGAFCIVSSDSDFTPLVTRIREAGLSVFGFGEPKTPKAFIAACTTFVDTKTPSAGAGAKAAKQTVKPKKQPASRAILDRVAKVIIDAGGKTEKMSMVSLGQQLKRGYPEFDLKNYPHASLSKFLAAYPSHFEMVDGGFVTLK